MLGRRRRRRPNIKPTPGHDQRLLFAGRTLSLATLCRCCFALQLAHKKIFTPCLCVGPTCRGQEACVILETEPGVCMTSDLRLMLHTATPLFHFNDATHDAFFFSLSTYFEENCCPFAIYKI